MYSVPGYPLIPTCICVVHPSLLDHLSKPHIESEMVLLRVRPPQGLRHLLCIRSKELGGGGGGQYASLG
jgi:hypothetical protein